MWPAEAPELRRLCEEYLDRMGELEKELLTLLGDALGLEPDFFSRHMDHPTYGFNINWYPGVDVVGEPEPGQFRIGPHTDFGTVTILDRQAGKGGLQVYTDEGGWEDAPFDPEAFTINIGDLMARWTGDRWRSGRHRVLPPPADSPAEELMSLVYFGECTPARSWSRCPRRWDGSRTRPSTRTSICGGSWTRSPSTETPLTETPSSPGGCPIVS